MKLFESVNIGNLSLQNRMIRSATFEGMCDEFGFPKETYLNMYRELAKSGIGAIITGFAFICKKGKAMQPGQAGIDSDEKIPLFRELTNIVHKTKTKIIMQIAHAGRQTSSKITGGTVYGVSARKSAYFNENPQILSTDEIYGLVDKFAVAALRAKHAGIDGIQIHAAHGYLVHQFLLPLINNRKDIFGVDKSTRIGTKFLDMIIDRIREKCGDNFPILIKVSASDNYHRKFTKQQFENLIKFLDSKKVAAIEISFGTMDYALNIFRGSSIPYDTILKHNPLYKLNSPLLRSLWKITFAPLLRLKIKRFTPMYNLSFARIAKQYTSIPIICVGGFRSGVEMNSAIANGHADFVSLSRPFICEPDYAVNVSNDMNYVSKCVNCNTCAVMCDSQNPTRCYRIN